MKIYEVTKLYYILECIITIYLLWYYYFKTSIGNIKYNHIETHVALRVLLDFMNIKTVLVPFARAYIIILS